MADQLSSSLSSSSSSSSASFIIISTILTTIVVGTFVGNFFVIVAILIDKNLQTTANQLVLSLAVADLMVACLVMPLGAYNDLHQGWYLGKEICEFWTSADVLCCTASILNLLAIALDRYWAVTNVDYIYRRTRRRVNTMILCVWLVGAIVSLAPIFGWKDPDFADRVLMEHKCMVSQDVAYQVFATISTFYAPLVVLLALYWRIFQVARKRIRRKPGQERPATAVSKFDGLCYRRRRHRHRHQHLEAAGSTGKLISEPEGPQTITSPERKRRANHEIGGRPDQVDYHLAGATGLIRGQVNARVGSAQEAELGSAGNGDGNSLTYSNKLPAAKQANFSDINNISLSLQDPVGEAAAAAVCEAAQMISAGRDRKWAVPLAGAGLPSEPPIKWAPGRSNDKTIGDEERSSSKPLPLNAAGWKREQEQDQPSENLSNLKLVQQQHEQKFGTNQLFAATQALLGGQTEKLTWPMFKMDVVRVGALQWKLDEEDEEKEEEEEEVAKALVDRDGNENNNNNLFRSHTQLASLTGQLGDQRTLDRKRSDQVANLASGSHLSSSMQDQLESCCCGGCNYATTSKTPAAKISVGPARVERKRGHVEKIERLPRAEADCPETISWRPNDDDGGGGLLEGAASAYKCNENKHLHRCCGAPICEPLEVQEGLTCPMGQEGTRLTASGGLAALDQGSAKTTITTVRCLGGRAVSGQNQPPGRRSRASSVDMGRGNGRGKRRRSVGGAALGCTGQATPGAPTVAKSVTVTVSTGRGTNKMGPTGDEQQPGRRQEGRRGCSMEQGRPKMNDNKSNESLGRRQTNIGAAIPTGSQCELARSLGNNNATCLDGSSKLQLELRGGLMVDGGVGCHIVPVEGLQGHRDEEEEEREVMVVGEESCWFKWSSSKDQRGCSKEATNLPDGHHLSSSLQESNVEQLNYCCGCCCCCRRRLDICSTKSGQVIDSWPSKTLKLSPTSCSKCLVGQGNSKQNNDNNNKIVSDKIETLPATNLNFGSSGGGGDNAAPESPSSTSSSSSSSTQFHSSSISTSTSYSSMLACAINPHSQPEVTTTSKVLVIAGLEHGCQTNLGCGAHREPCAHDHDDGSRSDVVSGDDDDEVAIGFDSNNDEEEEEQSMASLSAAFPPPLELLWATNRSPAAAARATHLVGGTKSTNGDDDDDDHKPRRKFELLLEVDTLEGGFNGGISMGGVDPEQLGNNSPGSGQLSGRQRTRHRQRIWPASLAARQPDVNLAAASSGGPEQSLGHGLSGDDGCQVQQLQLQLHGQLEKAADAGGQRAGTRLEGYKQPLKPDNNHKQQQQQQQQQHSKARSLDIRRRFRALGQLVSFVQTSRNFNSSSSAAETSQSGEGCEQEEEQEEPEADGHERQQVGPIPAVIVEEARKTIGLYNVSEARSNSSVAVEYKRQPKQTSANSVEPGSCLKFGHNVHGRMSLDNHNHKYQNRHKHQQARRGSVSLEYTDRSTCLANSSSSGGHQDHHHHQQQHQQQDEAMASKLSVNQPTEVSQHSSLISGACGESSLKPRGGRAGSGSGRARRANLDMKREKKAAKTLAIITGVFVCCWLPFFLNAIIMPICGPSCTPSDLILSILLWLGYLNSLLNPIIYTIFSPDFRLAFRRLLCWPPMAAITASGGTKSFR